MGKNKEINTGKTNKAVSITFIRFLVCFCLVLSILFIKNTQSELYQKAKTLYLNSSTKILDEKNLNDHISSAAASSFDFLKICTLKIFRSVTS